jgi:hypothetical protein
MMLSGIVRNILHLVNSLVSQKCSHVGRGLLCVAQHCVPRARYVNQGTSIQSYLSLLIKHSATFLETERGKYI